MHWTLTTKQVFIKLLVCSVTRYTNHIIWIKSIWTFDIHRTHRAFLEPTTIRKEEDHEAEWRGTFLQQRVASILNA